MKRKDPVAELLKTANKKEQVAQIEQLIQLVNAPTMTIVITFDSRSQKVDAKQVGAEGPNEIVQQILDAAKNLFNQQEIARQVTLAQQGGPVDGQIPANPEFPPVGDPLGEDIPADPADEEVIDAE